MHRKKEMTEGRETGKKGGAKEGSKEKKERRKPRKEGRKVGKKLARKKRKKLDDLLKNGLDRSYSKHTAFIKNLFKKFRFRHNSKGNTYNRFGIMWMEFLKPAIGKNTRLVKMMI